MQQKTNREQSYQYYETVHYDFASPNIEVDCQGHEISFQLKNCDESAMKKSEHFKNIKSIVNTN